MTTNALLAPFNHPFQASPFSDIQTADFLPAFEEALKQAAEEVNAISNQESDATFTNTIEALEFSGMILSRISDIFFNLNSAETNDEIQKIAQEVSPKLAAFSNDVLLNESLFKRVKHVWENRESVDLSIEQQTLLEKSYLKFVRNGALLNTDGQIRLREIDAQLSKLSLQFGENVLKDTNSFELFISNEDDIKGLPDSVKEVAAQEAKDRKKEGWIFTLQYPSYVPFMTYAENRELRKQLFMAFSSRGFKDSDTNNEAIILEIVTLKKERAQLLGYASHADYTLERRMAESPARVNDFLDYLLSKSIGAAKSDVKQVQELATKDGIHQIERWDFAYYSELLKKSLFDLDEELLKPYLELDSCINGMFETATKLYGIQFKERNDIPTYHPDVKTYEVLKDEKHVSLFYADFHPRKGKRAGAWMTSFRGQHILNGEEFRPHASIVCNFSKPTSSKPSLLTFNELTTLFHEFGHALHGMLAKGSYPSITGTSVFWDFVELPSQIFENWCYEPECLELFAKHYETGEVIPNEFIQKIQKSSQFQEGYQTVRQVSFGLLDMGWHQLSGDIPSNVGTHENNHMKAAQVLPEVEGTNMSCAFSHIFQGGYSAGYYSYKWAEVLDADAFELFKQTGIFTREVASAFQNHILAAGGSEHPMTLYKRFRGQEPDPDALLRRAGLVTE
jgi:peptidyl-dipeptidase Dcp